MNTFGHAFRVTTFGESHGGVVGAVIDGCPPLLDLSVEDVQTELDRRRPGQSALTTARSETDQVEILSGVFEGRTTGAPITLVCPNRDARPQDYDEIAKVYRPSHADFTTEQKYGVRDPRGGGRSSARETLARVAAGAVAQKWLREKFGIEFLSHVVRVAGEEPEFAIDSLSRVAIEESPVRCPDPAASDVFTSAIQAAKEVGDSVGGVVRGIVRNVPVGIGDPVFAKLDATLAGAMLGINAAKGFSMGLGFESADLRGSENNDEFETGPGGEIRPRTNRAGGTLGGISTGADLDFRVAFKPTATIGRAQSTVDTAGQPATIEGRGRHDPCVVPRAVPIVDAMAALVVMDHVLLQRGQCGEVPGKRSS